MGKQVASVFQDPRSQFFTVNSSSEVAFGLENFGLSHDVLVARVNESFQKFGLDYLKDRSVLITYNKFRKFNFYLNQNIVFDYLFISSHKPV